MLRRAIDKLFPRRLEQFDLHPTDCATCKGSRFVGHRAPPKKGGHWIQQQCPDCHPSVIAQNRRRDLRKAIRRGMIGLEAALTEDEMIDAIEAEVATLKWVRAAMRG